MADEPDWVPPGVDTGRANAARVYDYLLGGSHNFLVDQDAGRAFTAVDPNARTFARANRAFLGRAVRFLAGTGIRQFLDIGSGIPTQGNVHEVAQQADPAARVVYADIDPVAIAHSKVILDGNDNAAVIDADLREPEKILDHEAVGRLIRPGEPTGLLLVAVLHFIADADDPWNLVARAAGRARAGQLSRAQSHHGDRRDPGGEGLREGVQPDRVHPDPDPAARGHPALLRRFRAGGAGAGLRPAVAARLARRRARGPQPVREPGGSRPESLTGG